MPVRRADEVEAKTVAGARDTTIQVLISAGSDTARAAYRVLASAEGEPVLLVEEEYRLAEGGRALIGTVKITSLEGGKPAGSYLLHRRFEKEP